MCCAPLLLISLLRTALSICMARRWVRSLSRQRRYVPLRSPCASFTDLELRIQVQHVFPMYKTGRFIPGRAFSSANVAYLTESWYRKSVVRFARREDKFARLVRKARKYATPLYQTKARSGAETTQAPDIFDRSSPPLPDTDEEMSDEEEDADGTFLIVRVLSPTNPNPQTETLSWTYQACTFLYMWSPVWYSLPRSLPQPSHHCGQAIPRSSICCVPLVFCCFRSLSLVSLSYPRLSSLSNLICSRCSARLSLMLSL